MKAFITSTLIGSVVFFIVAAAYFGDDIREYFNEPQPTASLYHASSTPEREVVVEDRFDHLVEQYKTSEEGQQVLDTWARQKAIEDLRADLDAEEERLLKREATL